MKKAAQQTIVTEYISGLGDYLDRTNIRWSSLSIDYVSDFVCIYLPNEWTAQDVWQFTIEFTQFKETIY
jgi:hypothetical protein